VYYSEQKALPQSIAVKHSRNPGSEIHFLIPAISAWCAAEDHCSQWVTQYDSQMIGR